MSRYRVLYDDGTEIDVDAASSTGFATIHDREAAWSIVDLTEFPDSPEQES